VAHTANGAAVSPTNPEIKDSVPLANATRPSVEFSSPVLATDTAGTIPSGTFTLTGPQGAVATTPALRGGFNHQVVRLTPTAPLLPETTYTIAWTGVKAAAVPKQFNGQNFPDGSAQFTTAAFRMQILDDPAADTRTSNANIRAQGLAVPGVQVVAVNLDRRVDVEPTELKNGNLHVIFNNAAAGVSPASLVISELSGTANTPSPIANFTAGPTAGDTTNTNFTIALPASYQPKFGQKYEVRANSTITNPTTGKTIRAEGCTVTDCSDVKSFTTRRVGAAIAAFPSTTAPTGFDVNFTDPINAASLTPFLATEFKLFERDATGALSTTPTPITCTINTPTKVRCLGNASLGNSPKSYLASAVFLQTATPGQGGPAIVDPTVSTDASAQFFGSVSGNIFAACPP